MATKTKLRDAVDSYLKTHLKQTTRRSYKMSLYQMAKFVGESKLLKAITVDHLNEYQLYMYEESGLAQATINNRLKNVKTFFSKMVTRKEIKESPATELKTKKVDMYDDENDKAMPDEVLYELIMRTKPLHRMHLLTLLLADGGGRIGGIANLRWKDVDLSNRKATVLEKGDEKREIVFGHVTAQAFVDWKKEQMQNQQEKGVMRGDYVFSLYGAFLNAERQGQFFRRNCKSVGLGSWGPHSIRHWKGHTLGKAGVPSTLIARVLGHKSPNTTLRYLPQSTRDGEDVARRFAIRERDLSHENDGSKIVRFSS